MAATGKVIGTVTAVVGEAKATAADGTVRILQVGDKVYSDEAIATSEAGSINIALEGGKTLACDGSVDLALHESLLNVANAPASSDVDAIQRAIAAGQDPSQVAAATAAGGAPGAGGDADGGMHEPVILEQSNTASVVTSGFETEGGSLTIATPETESQGDLLVASASETESNQEASIPNQPVFESSPPASQADTSAVVDVVAPQISVDLPETAQAPVVTEQPEETPVATVELPSEQEMPSNPVVAIEDTSSNDEPVVIETAQEEQNAQPPVVTADQPVSEEVPSEPVVSNEDPIVVVDETPPSNEDPIVVVEETPPSNEDPIVVVDETPPSNEDPIVVVEETPPSNEDPIVVVDETPPSNEDPIVVVDETPPSNEDPIVVVDDVPEPSTPVASSIGYTISANTNQDEQIGFLTFSQDGNKFETLVFFGQEGQQKPTAVQLSFTLDHDKPLSVELEYVDAFAGNSDAGTGKTAQKIAIKDFSLDIDGTNVVLAQESDGLNIGVVGKKSQMTASVEVDLNGTPTTADDTVGEWDFGNPAAANNDRTAFNSAPDDTDQGIDILDFTSSKLDLSKVGDLPEGYEVVAMKGSAAQELTLSAADVLKMTDDNVLHILGGKEDTLNLAGGGWEVKDGDANAAGNQPTYFGWVEVKNGATTLLVDPDVNINLM